LRAQPNVILTRTSYREHAGVVLSEAPACPTASPGAPAADLGG
jgi:hypothetical protein